MSLQGTVRQAGPNHWTVEHTHHQHENPIADTCAWRILEVKRTGARAPDLADGLVVTSGGGDWWSVYRDGEYLRLQTEHEGTITTTAISAPKVRAGIETRYRNGRWEKYLKAAGWVAA